MILAVMLLAAAVAWCSLNGPSAPIAKIPWPVALALLLAVPLYAAFVAWWTVRSLRRGPRRALQGIRYFRRARILHRVLWIVSAFSLCRWWSSATGSAISLPLARELFEWLPVWGTYLASSLAFYSVETEAARWSRKSRDVPDRAGFLVTRLRHDLLLWALPAFLCVLVLRYLPSSALRLLESRPLLGAATAVSAIWLCTPRLVLWMVGARRLPDPVLRRTLQRMADRWGVTLTDVRLWPTGNSTVNAAAVGFWPRRGTLLLTDRLVAKADPGEVVALAAHEIAHIRRHHLPIRFAAVMMPLGASFVLSRLNDATSLPQWWVVAMVVSAMLPLASVVARWTEYDADRWAQRQLAQCGADVDLRSALRSLALAHPSARRGGYLHPSLVRRLEALARHHPAGSVLQP